MSELAKYIQRPPYYRSHKPAHFQQRDQGTLCYIMQMCISFILHTTCTITVAQRSHASAQHAHLWTHYTLKYHPGTQQHTNKAYLKTHYAASVRMWPEHLSDLAA